MFLAYLKKEQKELFRDICIFMAASDDNFAESEKKLLSDYCQEMNVDYTENTVSDSYDAAIKKLSEISTVDEQRAIGFELMGMVMADRVYEPEERTYVEKYSAQTGIPMNIFDDMVGLIDKIYDMNEEIKKIVFGK